MAGQENYISSRVQYYRFSVYMKYLSDKSIVRKSENGSLTNSDLKMDEKVLSKFKKTYKEYLAWKKTDEAKQLWEAGIKDGTLRFFVEDLNNLTTQEKKKQDTHLEQLKTDDNFHKLIVSDYNDSKIYDFGKEKNTFKFNSSDDIQIIEIKEDIEVPFAIVDESPTFTFCEDLETNQERKECMSNHISKHVNRFFNTKLADSLGLVGRQRINVIFKIDKEGHIIDVKSRAPHPALEDEAERVVQTLPQLIPGKQKGINVVVPYSLPILFQVQGDFNKNEDQSKVDQSIEDVKQKLKEANSLKLSYTDIPFGEVDQIPMYESCVGLTSTEDQKKCVSQEVSKFVNTNFNLDLAKDLGFAGRQRITVLFAINEQGNTEGIRARAPHPDLEKEAERVIKALPQFIPGKHEGALVTVMYSLPIMFQVSDGESKENKKN